jgi:hypothetical protein
LGQFEVKNLMAEICKHCNGTGEIAVCHNDCKDPRGCGDCLDDCHWCMGFGKLYPDKTIIWPVEYWPFHSGPMQ